MRIESFQVTLSELNEAQKPITLERNFVVAPLETFNNKETARLLDDVVPSYQSPIDPSTCVANSKSLLLRTFLQG